MKTKNMFLWALSMMLVACTQDFDENSIPQEPSLTPNKKVLSVSEGATKGALAVKVSEAQVQVIEAAATRSGETRSGIEAVDQSLNEIEASHFKRLFNDPLFEEDLRQADLHRWYKVIFNDEVSLQEAAQALAAHDEIEWVEYMHTPYHIGAKSQQPALPAATRAENKTEISYPMNDPELINQWHYHNTGEIDRSKAGADINLFKAWEYCTGNENIIVAVLDQPIDVEHVDLKANMWINTYDADPALRHGANFCTRKNAPIAIDCNYSDETGQKPSHGTHVAGTVAAVNGNGEGVCGVAGGRDGKGGVKIMGCQIFYKKDNIDEAAANAFIWAANRGALIAQCSFGFAPTATMGDWNRNYGYEVDAVNYFIEHERTGSVIDGGIIIFAAGNDGNTVLEGQQVKDKQMVPAAYAYVHAVAATSPDNYPAPYTCYGTWVDFSAPGGDSEFFGDRGMILSTIAGGKYAFMEGTSMACPHVSGVAALGLSYAAQLGKTFTTDEFNAMLRSATNKVDNTYEGVIVSTGLTCNLRGEYLDYIDVQLDMADYRDKMGNGVIDAFRMLMAVEGTPVMTVGKGREIELPVADILGGMGHNTNLKLEAMPENETEAETMGLSCTVTGSTVKIACSEIGSTRILLKAKLTSGNSSVSGSSITLPVAIICRENQAGNGGWL